ncbi:MAG: hypothetical protein RIR11_2514 [Bacteroidota bacterium]
MQTVILRVAFKNRDEGWVKLVAWLFSEGHKKKPPRLLETTFCAEEERFELPVPFSTTVFKTAPLNRSGTPPLIENKA